MARRPARRAGLLSGPAIASRLGHVEGAILAGGASSRMATDKARLIVGGQALVERVARALLECVCVVRIVLRPGEPAPIELPRVDDSHPERAPIVGLHAALRAAQAPAVLIAACDLPDLSPPLLLALLALVPAEGGADAVVPVGPRGPEPLLAVYRTRLAGEIERRIGRRELSLQALLRAVDTLYVAEQELRAIEPDLGSLTNLNRPADVAGWRGSDQSRR